MSTRRELLLPLTPAWGAQRQSCLDTAEACSYKREGMFTSSLDLETFIQERECYFKKERKKERKKENHYAYVDLPRGRQAVWIHLVPTREGKGT